MNSKRWFLVLMMVFVLGALTTTSGAQENNANSSSDAKGVAGSWLVDVNLLGAPRPFKALITFTGEGGVLETDAAQFPPPIASASPGHGQWVKTGKRDYAFTFVRLLFDPAGNFIGTLKLSSSVTLDKGAAQYNDAFKVEMADPFGNRLLASTGTGTATRIDVER